MLYEVITHRPQRHRLVVGPEITLDPHRTDRKQHGERLPILDMLDTMAKAAAKKKSGGA